MKKIITICLIILTFTSAHSQTWSEWTRQKKTQIKYLMKQIAALQVYIGYVQKGYEIANKGLTTISVIKNGEFSLHRDFFGALKMINPRIRDYAKVPDIISLQLQIVKVSGRSIKALRESKQFTSEELDHILTVFIRLTLAGMESIDELIRIVTAREYTMKDDERLKRIDALHADMQERAAMIQQFSRDNTLLAVQRFKELNDAAILKKLYGLKH